MSYGYHYNIDLQHLFLETFVPYIKMSKDSSAKCYQNNKERLQKKKLVKAIKVFLKKKKKSVNMVVNDTKIYQKMKKKKLVEYRKNYYQISKNALS